MKKTGKIKLKDYQIIYNNFWKRIVEYKNGRLNKNQIMKELFDYHFLLDQIPEIYDHITGGKLSKPNYPADVIKAEFDEQINKACEEGYQQALKDEGIITDENPKNKSK